MELSTRWRIELTWRTFFLTSVTVLALKLTSHACASSAYCSTVQSFVNVAGPGYHYNFTRPYAQLPLMVALAAALGLLGSMFVKLNAAIVKLRRHWSHSRRLLLVEVLFFPSLCCFCCSAECQVFGLECQFDPNEYSFVWLGMPGCC